MGEKASLSGQQIADAGLQEIRPAQAVSTRRIAQLRSEAMGYPERRATIIQALEKCIAQYGGTGKAAAACNAITSIMTVSMLEILQGD